MLLTAAPAAEPDLPMYWLREFPGRLDQVRVVRAFAAHLLAGLPALDDVLLVLDELVVNALRHTRSGQHRGRFAVAVHRDQIAVSVSVTDEGGPTEPRLRPMTDVTDLTHLEESGRGLLTVNALAAHWSWTGDPRSRTVRATFHNPPPEALR